MHKAYKIHNQDAAYIMTMQDVYLIDLFAVDRLKHRRNSNYGVWTKENQAEERFSSSFIPIRYYTKNIIGLF